MGIEYSLIRSRRKTISLQVLPSGAIVVRAPMRASKRAINAFVEQHREWICKKQDAMAKQQKNAVEISAEQRTDGIWEAKRRIPERVEYFAQRMGVTYNRITIREQKTRWGSCSSKGNLNFNWKLVLVPREALDYVVVHELAHRIEMNHSSRFWAIVEAEMPDYRERRAILKNYLL